MVLTKKELPINSEPSIHTYSSEINWLSILTSNNYTGKLLADLSFDNEADINDFKMDLYNVNIKIQSNKLSIEADEYEQEMRCAFYKPIKGKTRIKGRLDYQQYTNPWAYFGLFISEDINIKVIDLNIGYFVGCFKKSGFFKRYGDVNEHYLSEKNDAFGYEIIIDENMTVQVYINQYGDEWILLSEDQVCITGNLVIGIFMHFQENQFYNWYFMNYIQIHCCENLYHYYDGDPIDYYLPMVKNYRNNLIHPMLDFYIMDKSILEDVGIDIVQYAKILINKSIYIEVLLNERYVPNRWAYKIKDYDHLNLIYGYDDIKCTFTILGVSKYGKPQISIISYDELLIAFMTCQKNEPITGIKYETDFSPIEFSISNMCTFLKDYINSTNSSNVYLTERPKSKRIFGISVYDVILNNENNFKAYLKDERITHILCEHTECMCKRLLFLNKRGYLELEQYIKLDNDFKLLLELSQINLNLTLKNKINPSVDIQNTIKNNLYIIKDNEIKLFNHLLMVLEQFCKVEIE